MSLGFGFKPWSCVGVAALMRLLSCHLLLFHSVTNLSHFMLHE